MGRSARRYGIGTGDQTSRCPCAAGTQGKQAAQSSCLVCRLAWERCTAPRSCRRLECQTGINKEKQNGTRIRYGTTSSSLRISGGSGNGTETLMTRTVTTIEVPLLILGLLPPCPGHTVGSPPQRSAITAHAAVSTWAVQPAGSVSAREQLASRKESDHVTLQTKPYPKS